MVGTATAANNFFRQIGASVGTALVGALFTMRLTADVAGKLTHVDNLSLATLTPQIVDALPGSAQSVIAVGYSDALLPLFLWFVPLMLACLVMMLLLKRHPLRHHHQPRRRGKVGRLWPKTTRELHAKVSLEHFLVKKSALAASAACGFEKCGFS